MALTSFERVAKLKNESISIPLTLPKMVFQLRVKMR